MHWYLEVCNYFLSLPPTNSCLPWAPGTPTYWYLERCILSMFGSHVFTPMSSRRSYILVPRRPYNTDFLCWLFTNSRLSSASRAPTYCYLVVGTHCLCTPPTYSCSQAHISDERKEFTCIGTQYSVPTFHFFHWSTPLMSSKSPLM